jgi:predicted PurR-regulated permease PerM
MAPIAKPVARALIIGIATLPHHDRLAGKFPGHSNRCAGVMVLAIAVCFTSSVARN